MSFTNKEKNDFQINFNIAKQHLSQRNILEAIPYLRFLQDEYPENQNLNYLLGVCYAEENIVNPISIDYLESATAMASLEYDPNSIEEKRVPIYVYYYLSIAYSQNGFCDQAIQARNQFIEIYPHEDQFYIEESKNWIDLCKKSKDTPSVEPIPEFPEFKPYSSSIKIIKKNNATTLINEKPKQLESKVKVDIEPKRNDSLFIKNIKTKRVEYSTKNPLYGVQLGAFKEVVPVSRFKELKNVDAFMDNEGLIRYVVGHFSIGSQAAKLLEVIRSKGYSDAFVVDVNNAKKFSDEVVSVDNINIKANPLDKLEYRIQIGAFRQEIPLVSVNMYFKIDGIEEFFDEKYTYLTVGKFDTYEDAKFFEIKIKESGIKDAFVVALNNGKKISLQQAKNFYTK